MPSPFKPITPFVTNRIYLNNLAADDTFSSERWRCTFDNTHKLWYITEENYRESFLSECPDFNTLQPFKAYGTHQHFL
jgi:hypothetical protein